MHDKTSSHYAQLVYKGRPLQGIRATAPFLHNGSEPTLYALLQAPADRPTSFCVGSHKLFNAIGTPPTQAASAAGVFPRGGAVLIAVPGSRGAGLILSAVIIAAAVFTALCHHEFSHLAPLSVFVALLVLVEISS